MYIESIKYQEKEGSKWKKGLYIGEYGSTNKSTILDENCQPLPKDASGYQAWDFRPNHDKRIVIYIEE